MITPGGSQQEPITEILTETTGMKQFLGYSMGGWGLGGAVSEMTLKVHENKTHCLNPLILMFSY